MDFTSFARLPVELQDEFCVKVCGINSRTLKSSSNRRRHHSSFVKHGLKVQIHLQSFLHERNLGVEENEDNGSDILAATNDTNNEEETGEFFAFDNAINESSDIDERVANSTQAASSSILEISDFDRRMMIPREIPLIITQNDILVRLLWYGTPVSDLKFFSFDYILFTVS